MSTYSHDLKKFADTGLQLRMPVDLVPATQYNRLTNALPLIEGELRTRDGLTLVGYPTEVSFVSSLQTVNPGDATAPLANTINPHGLVNGQLATLDVTAPATSANRFAFDVTNTAGAGANDGGAGTAWTNPNNVTSAAAYADVNLAAVGNSSQNVLCTTFGFAAPAFAAITTFIITFEVYFVSGTNWETTLTVQLLKAGTPTGVAQTLFIGAPSSSGAPQRVTLAFDGSAFSNTDLNNANFGVEIKATANNV